VLESINRQVGVIGTEATIESDAYQEAIHYFDAGAGVFSQACPQFAPFIENDFSDGNYIEEVAKVYLAELIKKNIDTLILGCTHYPLLEDLIHKVMGPEVKLISSAQETALEVEEILERKEQLKKDGKAAYRFIASGDESKFLELGRQFLGKDIKKVERISL
jgi:glutamate racemase